MVAPLGSQPIQPQYTSSVTPSIPATQPAAPSSSPTAPAAPEPVSALPNQGSQNSTHAHAVSDFTNSLNFPKIISKPGQDNANSTVQAITQMLESLTNHPPQPSLLEPIGQKLSAMVDKLMGQLEKERQDLGTSPETSANASDTVAPAEAATAEPTPAEPAVADSQPAESSAETASAEGPQEASSPEADIEAASETGDAGEAAEVSGPEAGAETAEASEAESPEAASAAETSETGDSGETESESAGNTAENSGVGVMAGDETVRGGDSKTQGDPNATIELKAMLEQRYATLFRDLIGEEAYQRLMEMLNK